MNSYFTYSPDTYKHIFTLKSRLVEYQPIEKSNGGSEIKGARGDVKPIQIYRTKIIPEIKGYYDIVSVSVMEINNKLTFAILAGDPNRNEKYETAYIWLILARMV
jgi:hypothetical protein